MYTKKGAMFSKLSQLDRFNFKSGAMFGLDARIALAIFGALSVISGAALYSAIQDSKVVAAIAGQKELLKSIESYMLDTGSDLPKAEISSAEYNHTFDPLGLTEDNGVAGWNGPYASTKKSSTAPNYNMVGYSDGNVIVDIIHVKRAMNNSWTNPLAGCTGAFTCNVWIEAIFPIALAKAMDLKYDGEDNSSTGNLRYRVLDSADSSKGASVYIKGPITFSKTH